MLHHSLRSLACCCVTPLFIVLVFFLLILPLAAAQFTVDRTWPRDFPAYSNGGQIVRMVIDNLLIQHDFSNVTGMPSLVVNDSTIDRTQFDPSPIPANTNIFMKGSTEILFENCYLNHFSLTAVRFAMMDQSSVTFRNCTFRDTPAWENQRQFEIGMRMLSPSAKITMERCTFIAPNRRLHGAMQFQIAHAYENGLHQQTQFDSISFVDNYFEAHISQATTSGQINVFHPGPEVSQGKPDPARGIEGALFNFSGNKFRFTLSDEKFDTTLGGVGFNTDIGVPGTHAPGDQQQGYQTIETVLFNNNDIEILPGSDGMFLTWLLRFAGNLYDTKLLSVAKNTFVRRHRIKEMPKYSKNRAMNDFQGLRLDFWFWIGTGLLDVRDNVGFMTGDKVNFVYVICRHTASPQKITFLRNRFESDDYNTVEGLKIRYFETMDIDHVLVENNSVVFELAPSVVKSRGYGETSGTTMLELVSFGAENGNESSIRLFECYRNSARMVAAQEMTLAEIWGRWADSGTFLFFYNNFSFAGPPPGQHRGQGEIQSAAMRIAPRIDSIEKIEFAFNNVQGWGHDPGSIAALLLPISSSMHRLDTVLFHHNEVDIVTHAFSTGQIVVACVCVPSLSRKGNAGFSC